MNPQDQDIRPWSYVPITRNSNRAIGLRSNWSIACRCSPSAKMGTRRPLYSILIILVSVMLLESCASYGPFHADTATNPNNSIRGPEDGRYRMAFIEFGD